MHFMVIGITRSGNLTVASALFAAEAAAGERDFPIKAEVASNP